MRGRHDGDRPAGGVATWICRPGGREERWYGLYIGAQTRAGVPAMPGELIRFDQQVFVRRGSLALADLCVRRNEVRSRQFEERYGLPRAARAALPQAPPPLSA